MERYRITLKDIMIHLETINCFSHLLHRKITNWKPSNEYITAVEYFSPFVPPWETLEMYYLHSYLILVSHSYTLSNFFSRALGTQNTVLCQLYDNESCWDCPNQRWSVEAGESRISSLQALEMTLQRKAHAFQKNLAYQRKTVKWK